MENEQTEGTAPEIWIPTQMMLWLYDYLWLYGYTDGIMVI